MKFSKRSYQIVEHNEKDLKIKYANLIFFKYKQKQIIY